MATIQFGRLGLNVTFGNAITGYQDTSSYDGGRQVLFMGLVKTSSLADTISLRQELPALSGQVVPIIWSTDDTLSGFYAVSEVTVDASAQSGSYVSGGLFGFTVNAKLIGTESSIEFQDRLIGSVMSNTKGIIESETTPYVAGPVGSYAFYQGSQTPSWIARTTSDGTILAYTLDRTPYPRWSVSEANYYEGAVQFKSGGYVRQGLHTVNDTSDWELSNGLVRVTPNGTSGRLDVEHFDASSWDAPVAWSVTGFAAEVGEWDSVTVLNNRPEVCTVRLTRSKSAGRYTLDLELRRGSRFVSGYLTCNTATNLTVGMVSPTSGTAITPTGASSAVAIRNGATIDGNRPVIGSANATATLATVSWTESSSTSIEFFIGTEINYGSTSAGDTAADLCLQYLGYVSEQVGVIRK